jgi:arylsulfatase A-like enzyme
MKKLRVLTGCACGLSVLALSNACSEKDVKPNILFILADDLRADALGCYGNKIIKTPSIDRLAETGIRFTNSYVMGGHHGAISAPSRAMLLSGKYLFNVYDKLADVVTMPMHFSSQGYETFGTGKWHNEKIAFENSFQKGRNVFLGGMADHFNIPLSDMDEEGKLSQPVKKGFSTDLFTEAATEFINDYSGGSNGNPFFCYVAFTAPHDPYSPRHDFIDKYNPDSIQLPDNFMPLHPFAFDNLNVRDENLLPWPRPAQYVKMVQADYYGLIEHLDESVGNIINILKKNGLYENTIIVFASDNGLAIGSHGLLGKQNLYEHSMKVPVIITGPGIPKGKVSDALVYLLDLYPTLTELCSLPLPEGVDGKSLVPVISGKSNEVRSSLFLAYRNTVRAVRTKEWKVIRYPERNYTQLFNLVNDPLELNNLAGIEGHESRIGDLIELIREWQEAVNDTIPLTAREILPLEYDHTKLIRNPDIWQPEYTLEKYFLKDRNDGLSGNMKKKSFY